MLKINNEGTQSSIISYLLDAINLTNNNYNNTPIKALINSYGIRKGKVTPTIIEKKEPIGQHIFYNHKLPIALKAEDYGDVLTAIGDTTFVSLKKNINMVIKTEGAINHIKFFKNGKIMYEWTDHIKEDNSLIREIGKTTILWKDNEIIWTKTLRKSNKKKDTSSDLNESILTMDIETIGIIEGKREILNPYLISWYDGKRDKSHSYFISDGDVKGTVIRVMKDICIRKYKGYNIYLHNFSKFDAMFLIKYLVTIGDCNPVIHKSKIISFGFKPNWKKDLTVTFYDSYLLLNSSLKNLCKSFSVDNPKSIFPFKLNDINYEGSVPDFNLFEGVTLEEYNNYKQNFIDKLWSFKDESIRYCSLDCVSLYQVLDKFNKLVFNKFRLNITDYPTIPSLAFSIFRSSYNKEENIHQLSGKIDKDIRSGYTGGSTDMFIPKNPLGTNIHVYDVNSLYPSVMVNNLYPIGAPTYFEGNILLTDPSAFGFFYCKIVTPHDLKHPILQLHHKTKGGIRTIAPSLTAVTVRVMGRVVLF